MEPNSSLPPLYLITDRTWTKGRSLGDVVKAALDGGVRLVQLREKDMNGRELFSLARELRELTDRYDAKLLINDRVDIALAVGADGVHLGRQSVSVQDARKAFHKTGTVPILRQDKPLSVNPGQSPLIGVSTHSLKEALQAEKDGADFITFGPVYYTHSKAAYGQPVGTDKLKEAAEAVNIPIYALGGIGGENIEDVLKAGVYGVAMISGVLAADDVKKEAEDILAAIADCRLPTPGC